MSEKVEFDRRMGWILWGLVVLMFLNIFGGYIAWKVLIHGDIEEITEISVGRAAISAGFVIISVLANILVAVWLNIEAKRLGRSRLIWTALPIVFGITAALLFYLIEVHNEIALLRKDLKKLRPQ